MYSRYCSNNNFEIEIVDMKETDGGYIDSITLTVKGEYAYGYLKNETGTARLIRQSPFNSDNARHTSFSAVQVLPDMDEGDIEIKIEDKDLEIYGQIGGGGPKAGGQARNKTASACRLKHFPSGIAFVVCTERDYHANKKTALKMLKAKLYDIEMKKKVQAKDDLYHSMAEIGFGSQIRSYVLQPYTMVVDHRTKYKETNASDLLDGKIDGFISACLHMR